MSDDTLTVESILIPVLEKGLGERTFADFEQASRGEIDLHTGLTFRRTKFKMRVGIHLGRPTQAILAEGQFVRMRSAPEYADYELKVLDAKNPDSCLYEQLVAEVGKPGLIRSSWKPSEFWRKMQSSLRYLWPWGKGKVVNNDPTS
ncbi:MAG: hypothetical protein EHM40_23140 [Chloroflexi bacterium]|nr:MAG: hypothetical protein EHM40_23140 [Chloroflexota bacterium]